MQVIGVAGRAGSGKDTVADWFVRELGYTKMAMADPMKEFCASVFGWSRDQLWGPSARRNEPDLRWHGLTPRRALQHLGTEWGRAMHQDVWVRYALDQAYCLNCPVVISDIRFDNEVQAVQIAGGVVVRIDRAAASGVKADHASEAGVQRMDFAFQNDGSLEELYAKLAAVFSVTAA